MNVSSPIRQRDKDRVAAKPRLRSRANLAATTSGGIRFAHRARYHQAVIVVLPLLLCGQFGLATPPAGAGEPFTPGEHARVVTADGQARSYLVHIPPCYSPEKPTPLVIAFHGAGINAQVMVMLSGLNKKADEAGFIVAYPNGSGLANLVLTWNAGGLPPRIAEGKPDDVAFVAALLDDLATVVNIDEKRIYATGMSNGGMMCYRLAAGLSDRIAAIAPVCGTMTTDQWQPARPMPVMHFHGTADRIVPFDGPNSTVPKVLAFKSVPETIRRCVEANGCEPEPEVVQIPDTVGDGTTVSRSTYSPCRDGAEVVLVTIDGGGHTWPGQPPPNRFLGKSTQNIAANDLMWEFFERHRRE
ncbi:MAG: PHB depolymerase family esterase [Thermoguttaceae bacterium]|jgi:polyhydroxybutyrate depolymerase|nr:PHB depolymerase family esterase [Thermoguttaceae bacterium]